MATINGILSSSYAAGQSKASSDTKSEIKSLQDKMSALDRDNTLSSADRAEKRKDYQKEINTIKESLNAEVNTNMENAVANATGIVNSMMSFDSVSNSMSGLGINAGSGLDFFFGANAGLSTLRAMNAARVNIESRARTLTSEIAMDKLRGVDTSSKQEKLANLTSNLSVMDENLNKNINSALEAEPSEPKEFKSVIDKINEDLAENQKKLDEKSAKKASEEKQA
ncbi:MAG: hypothetical protein LBR74_02580 [Eubacterium sp.]|jgi:hypothetical protein|nr:hypothetical protein [Eubacterium sp.]